MIDMHNHILFGVDDGAKSINDSIVLIKEAVNKGVSHIILTPHFLWDEDYNKDIVAQNFNQLKKLVINENLDVELYLGNEIYLYSNYYDVLEKGDFYTLAGSNFILIEFSLMETSKNIAEMCYEARIKGYTPIIAHVERYEKLYGDRQLLMDTLNEGALLQINASTLINKESKDSFKFVSFLLKNELISFVASDVHNVDSRAFYLDEAYKVVRRTCGDSYADKIFRINQQKIIFNDSFDNPKMQLSSESMISKLFRNTNLKKLKHKMKGDKNE